MKPILYLTALALVMAGCGGGEKGSGGAEALPEVSVSLGVVEARLHVRTQGLPGTIHPADKAVIASKLMAMIEEVEVVIGETVNEGDLLLRLDAREIQAQLEQAEAALGQLNRNHEREKALLAQSATTAESVRTLEDQIRLAQARLMEARTISSYTEIRAPFEGIITSKQVRRGDLAQPGIPLLTLEGKGDLEVHVQVPDSLLALPYGDPVSITAKEAKVMGRITEWSPAADPSSRTRLVKLTVEEHSGLRSGQYVRVNWPALETTSLWIPEKALSRIGQLNRVFAYRDGSIHLHLVKTGLEAEGFIQILAGLNAGEQVVMEYTGPLIDGQPASLLP